MEGKLNKEKLRNYRNMQIEINLMENRILAMQTKMNSPKYRALNEMRSANGGNSESPNENVLKNEEANRTGASGEIAELNKALNFLISDIEDKCQTINRLLSKCKKQVKDFEKKLERLDSLDRTVVTLYYIDCIKKNGEARTWNDVANMISYSLRRTQDIHKRAIEQLKKL
jgi:DNA-directed RNA polymerase specialized sigma subunit